MDSVWSCSQQNGFTSDDSQNQACSSASISIAEMIAQTANEFISEQVPAGFTYCAEYSMYYNLESGYYYDSINCLFYHPNTQCYYRYNHQSNIVQPTKWIKKKSKKRAQKLLKIEDHELDQLQVDVLECLFEVVDKCAFLAGDFMAGGEKRRRQKIERRRARGIERIFKMAKAPSNTATEEYPDIPEIMTAYNSSHNTKRRRDCETIIDSASSHSSEDDSEAEAEELRRWQIEEESSKHGACIRLIETNASSQSPPILHIITITGATIGFGAKADIQFYVQDEKEPRNSYYQAKFLVTQIKFNDTLVRVDSSSNIQPLNHEDKISFGSYVLLFHMHNGLNTCPGCEPGLFPASQLPSAEIGLN
uniref:OCRE domain-containing protein n=1 Tax=Ditylenchus dipsaci TaxID=166011 RepID=A0A915CQU6_9BILA